MEEPQADKSNATEMPEIIQLPEDTNVHDSIQPVMPTVETIDETEATPPPIRATTNDDEAMAKPDSTNTNAFLRPSPSETSLLSRSRSLQFPPKPKHSPDCKDNPYNL